MSLPIKVVLVEDSLTIRRQLIQRLESHPALRLVGEAADEATALAMVAHTAPHAVLLDLSLAQGGSGLNVLKALRARGFKGQVFVLSHQTPEAYRSACIGAGANGFFDKAEQLDDLLRELTGNEHAPAPQPLPAAALWERLTQTLRLAMRDGGDLAVIALRGDPASLEAAASAIWDALDLGDLLGWADDAQHESLCIAVGEPSNVDALSDRLAEAAPGLSVGVARMPAEALSAGGLMHLADARAQGRVAPG